ncbi:hypothetical protein KVL31_06080 [Helicobacter pylori]|nr:hypothetical protein KVL31_06080 [Helicobacter pylori]
MSKSKKELFLELAQPDENGVSRWVSVTEFVGKYQGLFGVGVPGSNGGTWCRDNSSLTKEFNWSLIKGELWEILLIEYD